jgi:hypothetical protein
MEPAEPVEGITLLPKGQSVRERVENKIIKSYGILLFYNFVILGGMIYLENFPGFRMILLKAGRV